MGIKKECTHPQDPADAIRYEKTARLKTDAATKRIARNHGCGDPVKKTGNRKNHAYYVHEDCAVRIGLHW
jgi:hypothetical protein